MSAVLFVIGALTSLGCGWNVVAAPNRDWKIELVWILGGLIGAGMMGFAAMLVAGCAT